MISLRQRLWFDNDSVANRTGLSCRSLDEVGSSLEILSPEVACWPDGNAGWLRRNSALIPRPTVAGLRGVSLVIELK